MLGCEGLCQSDQNEEYAQTDQPAECIGKMFHCESYISLALLSTIHNVDRTPSDVFFRIHSSKILHSEEPEELDKLDAVEQERSVYLSKHLSTSDCSSATDFEYWL